MVKAAYIIATNAGDGSSDNPSRPSLPNVGGKTQVHGDLTRLTGPVASPHRHTLIGGFAMADDNLDGLPGDGHVHYVLKIDGNWVQVTVDAPAHTHTLNLSASEMLIPDYFLFFWVGSDADAALINASPTCYPVVELDVTADDEGGWTIGDMQNGWASQDTTWWHARMLDVLGVQLPVEVDRGSRLVLLLLGALLSRQVTSDNERGYRYTHVG